MSARKWLSWSREIYDVRESRLASGTDSSDSRPFKEKSQILAANTSAAIAESCPIPFSSTSASILPNEQIAPADAEVIPLS